MRNPLWKPPHKWHMKGRKCRAWIPRKTDEMLARLLTRAVMRAPAERYRRGSLCHW